MKIIVKKVGCPCEVVEVEKLELDDMQNIVGGYVECMELDVGEKDVPIRVDMWLNEEGKLHGLEPNIALFNEDGVQDIVVGDVFFACHDEYGATVGLDEKACAVIPLALDIIKAMFVGDEKAYPVPLLPV